MRNRLRFQRRVHMPPYAATLRKVTPLVSHAQGIGVGRDLASARMRLTSGKPG